MNPASDIFGWAILIATFIGPVAAVLVTRFVDGRREYKDRQLRIFRSLMSNRAAGLSAETIQSLNLIEIDFSDKPKVLSAWKDYFQHLNLPSPAEDMHSQRFLERRQRLYVALLDAIAKAVGYKFEQLSILEGGYYPTLAARIEADQHAIREMLSEIAAGRRAVPIALVSVPVASDQVSNQPGE